MSLRNPSLKPKLTLFTYAFPFGCQETFLENELPFLTEAFQVQIVPLVAYDTQRKAPNCQLLPSVFSSRASFSAETLKLFLNRHFWSCFGYGFGERKWGRSGLVKLTKQALIVASMRSYLEQHNDLFDAKLWYFYWGTNSVNVLPFIKQFPPSVSRFHRFDLYDLDIPGGTVQVFRNQMFHQLKALSVISDDGATYLEQRFPAVKNKLHVHRLGVPDRGLAKCSEDNTLRIVTCSNLLAVKRLRLLTEALALIDSNFSIEWNHFGDGTKTQRRDLLSRSKNLPSQVRLQFHGRVPNTELMNYYRSQPVDLFVNISLSEGLPVSIMEALSFGIPVFATNCGGVAELVNGDNGLLLPLNLDSQHLAQLIKKFYLEKFQDQSLRKVARHSWSQLVDSSVNYSLFVEFLRRMT
jgi:colanic acid/amylovoran biosynthesis glycosyltransferase